MPNAAPKVARAAQGYTHDPAVFPGLPQAGPGNGWQMPSKPADLCGAAVDAAAAAVLQPSIAPRAEPELVHAHAHARAHAHAHARARARARAHAHAHARAHAHAHARRSPF